MIVETMFAKEVQAEVIADFTDFTIRRAGAKYKVVQAKMARKQLTHFVEVVTSPRKNKWFIVYCRQGSSLTIASFVRGKSRAGVLWYSVSSTAGYLGGGVNTRKLESDLVRYTRHFFARYSERAMGKPVEETKISDKQYKKIFAHYLNSLNKASSNHYQDVSVEYENDSYGLIMVTTNGICLGIRDNERATNAFNTFIGINDMYFEQARLYFMHHFSNSRKTKEMHLNMEILFEKYKEQFVELLPQNQEERAA